MGAGTRLTRVASGSVQLASQSQSYAPRLLSNSRLWTSRLSNGQANLLTTSARHQIEGRQLNNPTNEDDEKTYEEDGKGYDKAVAQGKDRQAKSPWHRQDSDKPPVARRRSAGAMVKGKLLTTPSRLLKLILPLTTADFNSDRKDVEPLALVVHPHQPLSYLERLIQSELPLIKTKEGKEAIPSVFFKAEDSAQSDLTQKKKKDKGSLEETKIDGKVEKTGVLNSKKKKAEADQAKEGSGSGSVESYSGRGREAPKEDDGDGKFVRWSASTEVGDFIRDAARGREFAVHIEGAPYEIRVGVPSFNDRTFYLRQRLRRTAGRIIDMAAIKGECDHIAHRSAQRIAMGGFAGLISWWLGVYYLTFQTSLGWDTMEPVTYLVGLSGLMGGYMWFLYHNREVSYRAALNLTISKRQTKLYQAKGFDLERWENLVKDGNRLRDEIKAIASEYDVEWDEKKDEQDERVTEALKEKRKDSKDESEDKKESKKEDDD